MLIATDMPYVVIASYLMIALISREMLHVRASARRWDIHTDVPDISPQAFLRFLPGYLLLCIVAGIMTACSVLVH